MGDGDWGWKLGVLICGFSNPLVTINIRERIIEWNGHMHADWSVFVINSLFKLCKYVN